MIRDLFALVFATFSRWTFDEYHAKFIERLPHRFLQGAVSVNPTLRSGVGFGELQELFAAETGRRWKNPELYPHLNRLITPAYPSLQAHINSLRIHVGLSSPREAITDAASPRVWRLREPATKVFDVTPDALHDITHVVLVSTTQQEPFPLIYRPSFGLFDDLAQNLYRGDSCQLRDDELNDLLTTTMRLLKMYSSSLYDGFRREIATVAMMIPQPGSTKSFSLRNFYIGGIFVSIAGPIALAEQFIHEYYHQCIWPWWMIEPPEDLPNNELTIQSPITGRTRPVTVMIHALLIYCSLVDFYRFVLSAADAEVVGQTELGDASVRLRQLETGITPLFTSLRTELRDRPKTRQIIELIETTCPI